MSVPPELMAALQGASGGAGAPAAPAPDAGANLPPGVMDSINQDAGSLGGGAPGQPDQSSQNGGRSSVDSLRDAISALDEYRSLEADDIDLAEAAKIYAQLQKLLAKDQQEREAAMGVTPAHKGMAKAYGAGPAAQ